MVELPQHGVIELTPTACLNYPNAGSAKFMQTAMIPATTNRLSLVMQDSNGDYSNGAGIYSSTNFNIAVTDTADTEYGSQLQNLYITLPELGLQMPNPVYNFTSTDLQDFMRAYSDFCITTQGAQYSSEGSVRYGNFKSAVTGSGFGNFGVRGIAQASSSSPVVRYEGDPNNYNIVDAGPVVAASSITVANYSHHAKYGWIGDKAIFSFPVVRTDNKHVSVCNLNVQFTDTPRSCQFYLLSTYSMAIAVEHKGDGKYEYSLVQGV